MIALSGHSRFPIFFSSDGKYSLGFQTENQKFNQYVKNLKGNFVAIHTLRNLQYKSRFVVNLKAINTELNKEDLVPEYLYVYPNKQGVNIMTNGLTRGIILKGGRKLVFIPLLYQRILSKNEIKTLLKIVKIEEVGLDRIKKFLEHLEIHYTVVKELIKNRFVLKIQDSHVYSEYSVLIDRRGRVLDVDFCVDKYQNLFLPELIMFVRENRAIHHISGFQY